MITGFVSMPKAYCNCINENRVSIYFMNSVNVIYININLVFNSYWEK